MTSGLSNSDFRTIMMTPRRDQTPSANAMAPPSAKPKKKRDWKKRPEKNTDGVPGEKKKEQNPLDLSGYRDRAKERREGADPDLQPEEKELLQVMATPSRGLDPQARKKMIEESKFLGGDIEHTHLVKGLDFALLQKTKKDMESTDKQKKKRPSSSEQSEMANSDDEDSDNEKNEKEDDISSDEEVEEEKKQSLTIEEESQQPFKILDEVEMAKNKKSKEKKN